MHSFSFSKNDRLLTKSDFLLMRKDSKRHKTFFFDVVLRPNNLTHPRLGLVVSRKYGCSVERNFFKRIVRESFRLSKSLLLNYDFLIIAKRKDSEREVNSAETTRHCLELFFKKYITSNC